MDNLLESMSRLMLENKAFRKGDYEGRQREKRVDTCESLEESAARSNRSSHISNRSDFDRINYSDSFDYPFHPNNPVNYNSQRVRTSKSLSEEIHYEEFFAETSEDEDNSENVNDMKGGNGIEENKENVRNMSSLQHPSFKLNEMDYSPTAIWKSKISLEEQALQENKSREEDLQSEIHSLNAKLAESEANTQKLLNHISTLEKELHDYQIAQSKEIVLQSSTENELPIQQSESKYQFTSTLLSSIQNPSQIQSTSCCTSHQQKILEQQSQIDFLISQLEAKSTEIEKMRSIFSMTSACASEETNLPASSISPFPPLKTSSQHTHNPNHLHTHSHSHHTSSNITYHNSQHYHHNHTSNNPHINNNHNHNSHHHHNISDKLKDDSSAFNKTFDQQSLTEEIRRFNAHSKLSLTNSNLMKFLHNANLSSEPESSDDHSQQQYHHHHHQSHSHSQHHSLPHPIAPSNSALSSDPIKPPLKNPLIKPHHGTKKLIQPPTSNNSTLTQPPKPSNPILTTFFFSTSSSSSSPSASPSSPSRSKSPNQQQQSVQSYQQQSRSPLPQRMLSQLTSYLKEQTHQTPKQPSQPPKEIPLRPSLTTPKPSNDTANSFVVVVATSGAAATTVKSTEKYEKQSNSSSQSNQVNSQQHQQHQQILPTQVNNNNNTKQTPFQHVLDTVKSRSLENKFQGIKETLLSSQESISQAILKRSPRLPDSLSFYNSQKQQVQLQLQQQQQQSQQQQQIQQQQQQQQQPRFASASATASSSSCSSSSSAFASSNLEKTPMTQQQINSTSQNPKYITATQTAAQTMPISIPNSLIMSSGIAAASPSLSGSTNTKVCEIISPKKQPSRSHHIPVKPSPKPASSSSVIQEQKLSKQYTANSTSTPAQYQNKTFSIQDDVISNKVPFTKPITITTNTTIASSKQPQTSSTQASSKQTDVLLNYSQGNLKEEKRLASRVHQIQAAAGQKNSLEIHSPNKPFSATTPFKSKRTIGRSDEQEISLNSHKEIKDEERSTKPRRMPSFYSQTMQMKIGELSEIVGSTQMDQIRSITTRKKQSGGISGGDSGGDHRFEPLSSMAKHAALNTNSAQKERFGGTIIKPETLLEEEHISLSENRNQQGYLLGGVAQTLNLREDKIVGSTHSHTSNYKDSKLTIQIAKREVQSATHKSQQALNPTSKVFQNVAGGGGGGGSITRPPKNNAFIFNENFQVIAQQHLSQQQPQHTKHDSSQIDKTLLNSRAYQSSAVAAAAAAAAASRNKTNRQAFA